MTKAQDVRRRRLEKRQLDLTYEAGKVFDWILDLIDADTQRGFYGSIELYVPDEGQDEYILQPIFFDDTLVDNIKYNLFETFSNFGFDKSAFFERLKVVIEKEEGYKVNLTFHGNVYDATATILEIVIK